MVLRLALVRARVRLLSARGGYSSEALVDTGARMSLVDRLLAERVGVEYTGRSINFVSVSGHIVKASEAIIPEFELDGEALKYEAVAVAGMPRGVKEALKDSGLDENLVVGLLTLERAGMIPDTASGRLERVGSFILIGLAISPSAGSGRFLALTKIQI